MFSIFSSAARIALIYTFFAGLWILFSDMALESMVHDLTLMSRLQTYKGWFFVLVTAVMLCFLVYSALLKIERINEFDPLTGLLNHHMFMEQLNRKLLSTSSKQKGVVIFQDIDHFSKINEALGFDQANQALAEYARELKASLHSNVLIARFPPDQFAIAFISDPDLSLLEQRVAQLKQLFAMTMLGFKLSESSSMGIAIGPQDGADAKALMSAAAEALVKAKKGPRDSIEFFNKTLSEQEKERHALVMELKQALQNQQLFLVYQPQYALQSGELTGVEVLARWCHPEKGFIAPDVFVTLAEEYGLCDALSAFVVARSEQELAEKGLLGEVIKRVSINISALEFNSPALMDALMENIQCAGKLAPYLQIEITETATLDDLEKSAALIERLKTGGLKFSVDDFGTGYTSLAMLKDLPIDEIKIDRSFINELEKGGKAKAIVDAIIGMSRGFGIDSVAEGIETQQQLELLKASGCSEGQGYFLAMPMTIDKLVTHLGMDPEQKLI